MKAALLVPRGLPLEFEAFAAGLEAADCRVVGEKAEADFAVIWGGAPPPRRPTCPVWVAENGYWSPPGAHYCALAVGGHNGSGRWPQGNLNRFGRLGVDLKPWRESGDHILVCPSRGIGQNPQPAGWVERVGEILARSTGRQIRVRPHPGNWKTLVEHPDISLARDLAGAWACVIWASAAGIRALAAGVPVIQCAPSWICSGAAGSRLEEVDSLAGVGRLEAFASMASAQWTLEEIAAGTAIRALLPLTDFGKKC